MNRHLKISACAIFLIVGSTQLLPSNVLQTGVVMWTGPGWYSGIWFENEGAYNEWGSYSWGGPGWYDGYWFNSQDEFDDWHNNHYYDHNYNHDNHGYEGGGDHPVHQGGYHGGGDRGGEGHH